MTSVFDAVAKIFICEFLAQFSKAKVLHFIRSSASSGLCVVVHLCGRLMAAVKHNKNFIRKSTKCDFFDKHTHTHTNKYISNVTVVDLFVALSYCCTAYICIY